MAPFKAFNNWFDFLMTSSVYQYPRWIVHSLLPFVSVMYKGSTAFTFLIEIFLYIVPKFAQDLIFFLNSVFWTPELTI